MLFASLSCSDLERFLILNFQAHSVFYGNFSGEVSPGRILLNFLQSSLQCTVIIPHVSAEQYTGFVVIPQYWFLIPSNFLNTVVP